MVAEIETKGRSNDQETQQKRDAEHRQTTR
jgi:hypothetical protein